MTDDFGAVIVLKSYKNSDGKTRYLVRLKDGSEVIVEDIHNVEHFGDNDDTENTSD